MNLDVITMALGSVRGRLCTRHLWWRPMRFVGSASVKKGMCP